MTTLTRLNCGKLHGDLAMFETGAEGQVTLPVNAWLVRHPRGSVLFDTGMPATFCCYFARTLDGGALPTFGHDLDEQQRSIARLRKLRDDGATIIPGHDIDVVRSMPRVLGTSR